MFVTLGYYRRKPGLSWEEFSHHWRYVHGPLIASIPGVDQHIRRYVQHHLPPREPGNINGPFDSYSEAIPFDGFSEVWYANEDSLRLVSQCPGWELLGEDEERFLDKKMTRVRMVDQQVVQINSEQNWSAMSDSATLGEL